MISKNLVNGARIYTSSIRGIKEENENNITILETRFQIHVSRFGVTMDESAAMLGSIETHLSKQGFEKIKGEVFFPLNLTQRRDKICELFAK